MSTPARHRFNWLPIVEWCQRFGAFITVAAIALFGFWGGHFLLPGQGHPEPEKNETIQTRTSAEANQVALPTEKLAAANLVIASVEAQAFQAHKAVPGSITYDATKKVELRATVTSIVKKALVRPTQSVEQGQPILVLTGPEIGAARGEISQCEASVGLLEKEYQWTLDTHSNLKELLAFLNQSPTPEQIKSRFDNKNLGEHREEILSAYSEVNLARRNVDRTNRLEGQGAIAEKTADERRSSLEIASAKFNSIREETAFQISQGLTKAEAKLDTEKKRLAICREQLESLLGPYAGKETDVDLGVTEFVFSAPRAGQIVELQAVESARFEPGEVMAEIADTSGIWVEAQISQRDWHSVTLAENQQLTVHIPALPDREFVARVCHIGSSVSKTTMAIPLVAELRNPDNLFRPGMSVWVDIPTSDSHSAITIPIGAVQRIEMEPCVFVQVGESTFERRAVSVGEESADQVEIKSGLEVGEKVVVEGAFFLKSELLLAEEE